MWALSLRYRPLSDRRAAAGRITTPLHSDEPARPAGRRPRVPQPLFCRRSRAAVPFAHHHAEVRTLLAEADHAGSRAATPSLQIETSRKKAPSFTLAQEERFLQGKWVVTYDASSLFGPGAVGAQEIVLTGRKSAGQFSSITGVSVVGFFGLRSYYQFGSWGYYQFLNKKLVRLTITGASPTEYLNSGIIVMDGQSMPIQFVNKNQFVVDGQTYNREALNQSIFNS